MIHRRTQTAAYWQEQFAPTEKDINYLYGLILDGGKPVSTLVLAQALIDQHCKQEEAVIGDELSRGAVYQPKETYQSGDSIIFPVFEYALGTVVGTRPGRHPDYGEFTVIQIQFEDEEDVREFASHLQGEHRLNRGEDGVDLLETEGLHSPKDLHGLYGSFIEAKLVAGLQEREEFVSWGGGGS